MSNPNTKISIFFLASGLFILTYTILKVPFGTIYEPNAGFFPMIVGFCMVALALVLLFQSLKEERVNPPRFGTFWKKVVITAIMIFLYAFFLERAGFLICSFLFVFIYLKWVEVTTWTGTILFTIPAAFGSYYTFVKLLEVQLPRGILPF
jgi:putative tricarboxylic transport membrane protein